MKTDFVTFIYILVHILFPLASLDSVVWIEVWFGSVFWHQDISSVLSLYVIIIVFFFTPHFNVIDSVLFHRFGFQFTKDIGSSEYEQAFFLLLLVLYLPFHFYCFFCLSLSAISLFNSELLTTGRIFFSFVSLWLASFASVKEDTVTLRFVNVLWVKI